jgi:hypothetical protein
VARLLLILVEPGGSGPNGSPEGRAVEWALAGDAPPGHGGKETQMEFDGLVLVLVIAALVVGPLIFWAKVVLFVFTRLDEISRERADLHFADMRSQAAALGIFV